MQTNKYSILLSEIQVSVYVHWISRQIGVPRVFGLENFKTWMSIHIIMGWCKVCFKLIFIIAKFILPGFQSEFSVKVWTDLIDNLVIGLYILSAKLNTVNYQQFLMAELPLLLEDVSLSISCCPMDMAPVHFGIEVRNFISNDYPQWIGRKSLVA